MVPQNRQTALRASTSTKATRYRRLKGRDGRSSLADRWRSQPPRLVANAGSQVEDESKSVPNEAIAASSGSMTVVSDAPVAASSALNVSGDE